MNFLNRLIFFGLPRRELSSKTLEHRINYERTKIYFSNTAGSITALILGLFLALTLLYVFEASWTLSLIWAACLASLGGAVYRYDTSVHQTGLCDDALGKPVMIRLMLSFAIAVVWGFFVQLMPAHSKLGYALSYIAMTTFVNLGMLSFSVLPMQYLIYFIGALLPLESLLIRDYQEEHDFFYLILAIVVVTCEGILLFKALVNSKTAIRAILLNEKLKDQVQQTTKAQSHIEFLAYHDHLTGAFNRRYVEKMLQELFQARTALSILLFDINDFKPLNDTYGHHFGDEMLIQFTQTLQRHLPENALLGRFGGDEFIVIFNKAMSYLALETLGKQLKACVKTTYTINDIAVDSSTSVGWAMAFREADDLDALLRLADERMYADKKIDHQTTAKSNTDSLDLPHKKQRSLRVRPHRLHRNAIDLPLR